MYLKAFLVVKKNKHINADFGDQLTPLQSFINNPEIIYVFRHKRDLSSYNCIFYNSLIKAHIYYMCCLVYSKQT